MSEATPSIEVTPDGLGPWSTSKVKVLQKCPLQFYLKYIKKLKPEEKELGDDLLVTEYGKAAHFVIEKVMEGKTVQKAISLAADLNKTIPQDKWENIETLEYNIGKFAERISEFEVKNGVKHKFQELKIGITKDLKKAPFFGKNVWFRGVIDFGILLNNGDVILLDHKYGPDPAWGLKHFQFQLNNYLPLYHYGVNNVRGGQTGVHFIKHGDVKMDAYQSTLKFNAIMQELIFFIDCAVQRVQEEGVFFYERGNHCKWCDFSKACSSGKNKRTAGELQQYVDESRLIFKAKV